MSKADDKAAIVAKYRATTRCKHALMIIAPDPKRQRECEDDVATALWGVECAAKIKWRTAAQYKKDLQNLAKRLRADIELAAKAFPLEYQIRRGKDSRIWIAEELSRHLAETEQAIKWTSQRVRKGSPRPNWARIVAIDNAYRLLKKYGKKTTRSRDGLWHKLARVLLRNEQADLFDLLKRREEYQSNFYYGA
jgi:hypothetical protein